MFEDGRSARHCNDTYGVARSHGDTAYVMAFDNLVERYCTTDSGEHAQKWLQMQVIRAAYGINATVGSVYGGSVYQSSIIARVPGRSNRTTVIDAYLDSVAGDLSGYEG